MNDNRHPWFRRMSHIVVLSEKLSEKIAEEVTDESSPDLRLTVESIPFKIEQARALRLQNATVQQLLQGSDFVVPSLKERLFSKRPRREWLRGDAAFVFDYCVMTGMKVQLAPYRDRTGGDLTSSITVEWNPFTLIKAGGEFDVIPLLQIFKSDRIQYPPVQENVRSRTALVMKYAPKIIVAIQAAADRNADEAEVFNAPSTISGKDRQNLFDDVLTFCELLGLKARKVETEFTEFGTNGSFYPIKVLVTFMGI